MKTIFKGSYDNGDRKLVAVDSWEEAAKELSKHRVRESTSLRTGRTRYTHPNLRSVERLGVIEVPL